MDRCKGFAPVASIAPVAPVACIACSATIADGARLKTGAKALLEGAGREEVGWGNDACPKDLVALKPGRLFTREPLVHHSMRPARVEAPRAAAQSKRLDSQAAQDVDSARC